MFCKNCGKQIDENSRFCFNCGMAVEENPLQESDTNSSTTANTSSMPMKKEKSSFIKDTAEKIKGSRKLQIGIAAAAVVIILVVIILSAVSCAEEKKGASSAEEAFDRYINAQKNVDAEETINLTPSELYDYYYNKRIEKGLSDDEAKEYVDRKFGTDKLLIYYIDVAKIEGELNWIHTPGFIETADCEIIRTYTASSVEISEFDEYVKNKFGFKSDITGVVMYSYNLSLTSIEGRELEWNNMFGMCVGIGDKWYYVNDSNLWETKYGLKTEDQVDWITDWIDQ